MDREEQRYERSKDIIAFDDQGNRIFPVMINTICPIEHAEEATKIASDHFKNIEKIDIKDEIMFATKLAPIGETEPTHLFCSRFGYTNQLNLEVETFKRQNLSWCSEKEYSVEDNPEEIKSLFCCVTGKRKKVLEHLGLEIL